MAHVRLSILIILIVVISAAAMAEVRPTDLMGPSDISCSDYLGLSPDSQERQKLNHYVSGRIVAIVPASVQPFLRKQPWSRLESDLTAFCQKYGGEDLFIASAMLAHEYRCEVENYHSGCLGDT